jgi:2-dehydro-3-deoxyphosphogluconate aldolase/(4S)-4-hydroxy-2-oxoglutarate aldolase
VAWRNRWQCGKRTSTRRRGVDGRDWDTVLRSPREVLIEAVTGELLLAERDAARQRERNVNIDEILSAGPVIPVIVIERASDAVSLARALASGGVRVLEVTLRTLAALDAIRAIRAEVDGVVVGAGTILNARDLDHALAAGAEFGVSPGTTTSLLSEVKQSGLAFLPGVATASNVMTAMEAGFEQLKFFPAQQAGGLGMLRALSGPFPTVHFCPTGGVGAENAPDYLALSNVRCVGGSWIAPAAAIREQAWSRITDLARAASALSAPRPK